MMTHQRQNYATVEDRANRLLRRAGFSPSAPATLLSPRRLCADDDALLKKMVEENEQAKSFAFLLVKVPL